MPSYKPLPTALVAIARTTSYHSNWPIGASGSDGSRRGWLSSGISFPPFWLSNCRISFKRFSRSAFVPPTVHMMLFINIPSHASFSKVAPTLTLESLYSVRLDILCVAECDRSHFTPSPNLSIKERDKTCRPHHRSLSRKSGSTRS